MDPQEPRIAVITGGTGGIGRATALGLARAGMRVFVTGRSREAGDRAVAELRQESENPAIALLLGDVGTWRGLRELTDGLAARAERVDVLVHNAGLMPKSLELTEDGVEAGFAVNVLAPLRLTRLLAGRLAASGAARIIAVTGGELPARLALDNLQGERSFVGLSVYSQQKVAMMAAFYELSLREPVPGATYNVCYPGQAATAMTQSVRAADMPWWMRPAAPVFRWFVRPDGGASAARASRSTVHLATEPEGLTRRYVDTHAREARWPAPVVDPDVRAALWRIVAPHLEDPAARSP